MLDDIDTDPADPEMHGLVVAGDIILRSPAMQALYRLAARIAPTEAPVLVLGETGTGKDVLARFIAGRSNRPHHRMRTLNCATLPPQLVEAALFGHERGAFTGAVRSSPGVFEQADGGTVFLDEVGELSTAAQAALLRVLESGHLTRVGGEREQTVDVRVIAATNCDLEQMVEQGRFRRDLLYRLNTVTLELLPLRERREEILPLARCFLGRAAARWAAEVCSLSADVERLLLDYPWPGNVRQLRNTIDRAVLVCEAATLEASHLPASIAGKARAEPLRDAIADAAPDGAEGGAAACSEDEDVGTEPARGLRAALRRYEIRLIQRALARTGGNQRRAAELLEIPRRTLVRKLRGASAGPADSD